MLIQSKYFGVTSIIIYINFNSILILLITAKVSTRFSYLMSYLKSFVANKPGLYSIVIS